MTINISALQVELLTGSYASLYSANVTLFDINALVVTVNNPALASGVVVVGLVGLQDIQQCVVASEYLGTTQAQRDLWDTLLLTATQGLAISNTLIRTQTAAVWSASTTTRGNLSSLQTRPCSRGETLFGENTLVDFNSIYVALTQP